MLRRRENGHFNKSALHQPSRTARNHFRASADGRRGHGRIAREEDFQVGAERVAPRRRKEEDRLRYFGRARAQCWPRRRIGGRRRSAATTSTIGLAVAHGKVARSKCEKKKAAAVKDEPKPVVEEKKLVTST